MLGELLERTKNGCFASKKPAEAFILDADIPGEGLNDARTRAQKKLYARYGVATAKPAEFVILLSSQDTRALQEATAG
jgi:phage tail sheath protein FI